MSDDIRYIRCKRCNRPLKTESAQKLGYGPCCQRKLQVENYQKQVDIFSKYSLVSNKIK
jgi:hypothetical protein